jgi:Fe-S-cluster containining protein
MPIFHECQRCTACCRWPGQVRLSAGEIARLAAFKGLSEVEFIQRFTRLTDDRRGLALTDQPDGACVFLDGNDCAVQPVKPQQCRDFPNLWSFPGFEQVCRAVPRAVGEEEYARLVTAATGRPPPAGTFPATD